LTTPAAVVVSLPLFAKPEQFTPTRVSPALLWRPAKVEVAELPNWVEEMPPEKVVVPVEVEVRVPTTKFPAVVEAR
jgi:hypothetical protein